MGMLPGVAKGRLGVVVLCVRPTLVAGVLRVGRQEKLCVRAGCVGVAVAEAGIRFATDIALAVGLAFATFSVMSSWFEMVAERDVGLFFRFPRLRFLGGGLLPGVPLSSASSVLLWLLLLRLPSL